MEGDFGDAIVSTPQSRDRLENRGGQDDKMSRRVWEAVKASIREVGMGKTRGRKSKGGSGKKKKREGEEETKEREDSGSKENSGGMGNIG